MLIRRDFVAWSLAAVFAHPPIGAIAPFWDMQCVRIDPTISPGASSTVVGRCAGSILFFFDHSATRARFHFNSLVQGLKLFFFSLATDPAPLSAMPRQAHTDPHRKKCLFCQSASVIRVNYILARPWRSVWVCTYLIFSLRDRLKQVLFHKRWFWWEK